MPGRLAPFSSAVWSDMEYFWPVVIMPEHGNYDTACRRIPIELLPNLGKPLDQRRAVIGLLSRDLGAVRKARFFPPRTQCDDPATPRILSNEPPVAPLRSSCYRNVSSPLGCCSRVLKGMLAVASTPYDQAVRQRVLLQDLHHQLSKGMPLVLAAPWALCVCVASSHTPFEV